MVDLWLPLRAEAAVPENTQCPCFVVTVAPNFTTGPGPGLDPPVAVTEATRKVTPAQPGSKSAQLTFSRNTPRPVTPVSLDRAQSLWLWLGASLLVPPRIGQP